MFDLIENGDVHGFQRRMQKLKTLKPFEKREALSVRDQKERTLLHVAVQHGKHSMLLDLLVFMNELKMTIDVVDAEGDSPLHLAVVKAFRHAIELLIMSGAILSVRNRQGKTAQDIADEHSKQFPDKPDYRLISALLRTRVEWEVSFSDFKFNRVLYLISNLYAEIEPAKNCEKLLFVGGTGAGKSTLLNYLYGAKYEIKSKAAKPYAVCVDGIEVARTGQGMSSQTLYPLVMKKAGLNFVYCDLAGLADSRGSAERICAASSLQMLSKLPGKIKGILVVLDLPGFQANRGEPFKNTAVVLANMLNSNEAVLESVHFIITKVPLSEKLTATDIIDVYLEPLLETIADSNDEDEKALVFMLRAMQQRRQQIHIPDISTEVDRKNLIALFKNLSAKDSAEYNFLSYDNSQNKFIEVLNKIINDYLAKMAKKNEILPAELKIILTKNIESAKKLQGIRSAIELAKKQLSDLNKQKEKLNRQIKQVAKGDPSVIGLVRQEGDCRLRIQQVEMEIEHRNSELEHETKLGQTVQAEADKVPDNIKNIDLEIEANHDLYLAVFNITHVLELGEIENVKQFWDQFSQNNPSDKDSSILYAYRNKHDPLVVVKHPSQNLVDTIHRLNDEPSHYLPIPRTSSKRLSQEQKSLFEENGHKDDELLEQIPRPRPKRLSQEQKSLFEENAHKDDEVLDQKPSPHKLDKERKKAFEHK